MSNEINREHAPGDVFFDVVAEVSEGELLNQLDAKITSLVSAVMQTGNGGKMTLTITVKRKGGERQCQITPKITASIPEQDIPSRIVFADADGKIHSDDPLQTKMDFAADRPMRILPNRETTSVINVEGMPTKMAANA